MRNSSMGVGALLLLAVSYDTSDDKGGVASMTVYQIVMMSFAAASLTVAILSLFRKKKK
ncbi:MAG TPA: hypothetical protein VFK33_14650 [Bacillales bacterium]|nr:hypothetical protein [Bacillales bacterium]